MKVIVRFADGVLRKLQSDRKLGVDYRVRVRIFTDGRENALVIGLNRSGYLGISLDDAVASNE